MVLVVYCFCRLCSAKREGNGGNASRWIVPAWPLCCLSLSLSRAFPSFPLAFHFPRDFVRLSLCLSATLPYFWYCLGRGRFLHPCLQENGWLGVLQSPTLLNCACMQPRNAKRDVAQCTSPVEVLCKRYLRPWTRRAPSLFSCPPASIFLDGAVGKCRGRDPSKMAVSWGRF